jgi:hypothetical protein
MHATHIFVIHNVLLETRLKISPLSGLHIPLLHKGKNKYLGYKGEAKCKFLQREAT